MELLYKISCAGGRHTICRRSLQVDFWPFDLESGARVTCDVGYLCANFSLTRSLCSRLTPDVRDRQTDRQMSDSIIALCQRLLGAGHNNLNHRRIIDKRDPTTLLVWDAPRMFLLGHALQASDSRRKTENALSAFSNRSRWWSPVYGYISADWRQCCHRAYDK